MRILSIFQELYKKVYAYILSIPLNRRIFYVVFFSFLTLFIYIAYDMGSRTTPPWKEHKKTLDKYKVDHFKKKQL